MAANAPAVQAPFESETQAPHTLTRHDVAAGLLQYAWVAVVVWLVYTAWVVVSIRADLAAGR